MRAKRRWNQDRKPRTIEQMANAIAATVWKAASSVLLNLENDNFETSTQTQRVDVHEEVVCYLVHLADRWIYSRASEEKRSQFVVALAKDMARMLEDSRFDVEGPGEYQQAFLDKFNQRSQEYATLLYSPDTGAGFGLQRAFARFVAEAMGARDNKWIPDYIIGREAPEIEIGLTRSLAGLVRVED